MDDLETAGVVDALEGAGMADAPDTEAASHAVLPAPAEPLGFKMKGNASEGHRVIGTMRGLQIIFGTEAEEQCSALLTQCLKVLDRVEGGEGSDADDQRLFMLSIVKDMGPRDAVERMLAVQMAATHVALIRTGRSMATATQMPHLEAHSSNFNKLGRTFAAQMEALRKHRNGGQQKVQVEHVHVHSGGQAIVGDVHHGGRGAGDES